MPPSIVIFLCTRSRFVGLCMQEVSLYWMEVEFFLQKSNNLFSEMAGSKFHYLEQAYLKIPSFDLAQLLVCSVPSRVFLAG